MPNLTHTLVGPAQAVGGNAYVSTTSLFEISDAIEQLMPEDHGFISLSVGETTQLVNVNHVFSFSGLTTEQAAAASEALESL